MVSPEILGKPLLLEVGDWVTHDGKVCKITIPTDTQGKIEITPLSGGLPKVVHRSTTEFIKRPKT